MAITNAQQYQQLVNKRADGKRPGYRGSDMGKEKGPETGRAARDDKAISDRMAQTQQMADYNKQQKERDKLKEEILLTPIGRNKPLSKLGLYNAEFQRKRNIQLAKQRALQKYKDLEDYVVGDTDEDYDFTGAPKGLETLTSNINTSIESTRPNLYDVNPTLQGRFSLINPVVDKIRPDTQVTLQNTLNKARDYRDLVSNAPNMTNIGIAETLTDLANRGKTEDQINPRDGGGNEIFLPITPYQQDVVAQEPEEELSELQGLLANRVAYRFMADGGRAGFMGGGMPDDFIGGLADGNLDEMGRQMYGLGKLVKKATRAVKKIVKSPVGKAALAFGMYKLGGGLLKNDAVKKFLFAGKAPAFSNLTGKGVLAGIGGISALSGLMSKPEEDDEEETYYRGPGLDIDAIRRDPYGSKGPAYGFYAEGGDVKEPVAKDTMPLLDMDGMEKDYRADGGFVPIGRMERADDVPARLSKNEFVFTADAVRNAGDGDVDKGAEVMYNMMKNLESGGKVSEESQGLDGARDMFQTSKRLEEVL